MSNRMAISRNPFNLLTVRLLAWLRLIRTATIIETAPEAVDSAGGDCRRSMIATFGEDMAHSRSLAFFAPLGFDPETSAHQRRERHR